MSTTGAIRILHPEDSPRDAEILHERLRTGGIAADIVLVSDQQSFDTALARETFDLILSDYELPGYSGMAAVRLAHEHHSKTPVLMISGTVGEEAAVKSLHIGATDYLLKYRLDRLVPAVRRAIQHAEERNAREAAEAKPFSAPQLLRTVREVLDATDNAGDGM